MTLSVSYKPVVYEANGQTISFSVPWKFFGNEIEVKDESGEFYDSNSFAIYPSDLGGSVVFTTAPARGKKVIISRKIPLSQSVKFLEGEKFPAKDFEYAVDRLYMALQELSYDTQVEFEEIVKSIYTKAELDTKFADVVTKSLLSAELYKYYTKQETDAKIGQIDDVLDAINGEVV